MKKNILQSGTTLMEIVVVTAILSTVSLAFLGTFTTVSKFHEKNTKAIKAGLLAEEGIEALRVVKSQNFQTLGSIAAAIAGGGASTRQYFAVSTSTWGVTTTPEIIDGLYYRYFFINPVYRTGTYDVTFNSGLGTFDPNTIAVDVYVEWLWRNATNTNVYKALMTNL